MRAGSDSGYGSSGGGSSLRPMSMCGASTHTTTRPCSMKASVTAANSRAQEVVVDRVAGAAPLVVAGEPAVGDLPRSGLDHREVEVAVAPRGAGGASAGMVSTHASHPGGTAPTSPARPPLAAPRHRAAERAGEVGVRQHQGLGLVAPRAEAQPGLQHRRVAEGHADLGVGRDPGRVQELGVLVERLDAAGRCRRRAPWGRPPRPPSPPRPRRRRPRPSAPGAATTRAGWASRAGSTTPSPPPA